VAETSPAQSDGGVAAPGPELIEKGGYRYRRRRPEKTALYRVVQDNLSTLYAAVDSKLLSRVSGVVVDSILWQLSVPRLDDASCRAAR
jgi:hypothetical protein